MRARILLLLTAMLLITQGTWAQWNVTHNDASDKTGWTIDPTSTTAGTTVTVNYSGPHKVKSVTVAKKWRTPVVTAPTASNRTYDGTTQALVTGGSTTGGTLQYSLSSGSGYSTTVPTATNVGSYTVYYKVVGNEAYTDVAEQSVSVTISKANASVTAPTAKSGTFTYSGSAQTLFNTGSTTVGTMKYKVTTTNTKPSSTSDFKTTIDQGTNAATYYLWYYVDGGTNYNSTSVNSTAVSKTIGKVNASVTTAPTNKAPTYSGSAQAYANAGTASGGTMKYSTSQNGTYTTSLPSGTNAGSYTLWYYVEGDANHNSTSKTSVSCSIAKATATVTAPTAKSGTFTYSGSAQTLFNTGSTTGGTMKYKVTTTNTKPSSTSDFKTTIDQGTNAATYYLWYYVDGGTNYNSTSVNGTAVSKAIGKANASVTTAPTNKNPTYSGSAQAYANAGTASGGTMKYSTSQNGTYLTSLPTSTNAGSYTLWYYVEGDANHNSTSKTDITCSIAKADGYVILTPSSSTGWNDKKVTRQTVSVEHHGGSLSYTKSNNNNLMVTLNEKNNTVTIQKNNPQLPFAGETVTITSMATTNYNSASAVFTCEK